MGLTSFALASCQVVRSSQLSFFGGGIVPVLARAMRVVGGVLPLFLLTLLLGNDVLVPQGYTGVNKVGPEVLSFQHKLVDAAVSQLSSAAQTVAASCKDLPSVPGALLSGPRVPFRLSPAPLTRTHTLAHRTHRSALRVWPAHRATCETERRLFAVSVLVPFPRRWHSLRPFRLAAQVLCFVCPLPAFSHPLRALAVQLRTAIT